MEQIGHVYEGLLERTVKRVPETTLGLVGSQKAVNPTVALRELEEMQAEGDDDLLTFLLEKTGRSESGLRNALAKSVDEDLYHGILLASGSDVPLADRIKPFGLLLRTDSWGDPLAYRKDAFIVTLGAGRRETGTHYTPKSLTEPIVQHTLEPLAYVGPAEGKPRGEWKLKSPAQLLALKVCDMAMGSGAFLVQTCRWLGERLVEAWDAEEKAGRAISIEGVVLDEAGDAELLPRDQAERVLIARRLIASRCLYGVDINPMAVELAKLSLWLVTMMKNRPFSFLDHALKCGDSLLGVSQLKQLERFSIRDPEHAEPLLETANLWRHIEQAAALRRELEGMPSHTAAQIAEKARLHGEAEAQLAKLRAAADFLVAAELDCSDSRGWDTRRAIAASQMQAAWKKDIAHFQRLARIALNGRRPFHWPLEYPEAFLDDGFSAVVGNPPFISYYSRQSLKEEVAFAQSLATGYNFSRVNSAGRRFNSAMFFWERGIVILKDAGVVGLLNDMNLLENSFTPIREWLRSHFSLSLLVHGIKAFSGVASGQAFLTVTKATPSHSGFLAVQRGFEGVVETVSFTAICSANDFSFVPSETTAVLPGVPLGNLFQVNVGVVFSGATDRFLTEESLSAYSKPYMAPGGLKDKYQNPLRSSHYISFCPKLTEEVNADFKAAGKKNVVVLGKYERFSRRKIVIRQSAPELIATIDETGMVCPLNYFTINLREGVQYDLFYLLALLNSETLSVFARESGIIRMGLGKQPQIRKSGLDALPVPTPRDPALVEQASGMAKRLMETRGEQERTRLIGELEIVVKRCYADHSREAVPAKQPGKMVGKIKLNDDLQEPELALEPAKLAPASVSANPKDNGNEPGRSSANVEQTELLNAIFTCAARREVTDREDLARQVAETLGFQRLSSKLGEVIASGINSAIRRGLVKYEAQDIHRVAASYAELDHEFLVKAINASIRPGCVYTPEEVLHLAADYLGCKRLKDAFSDRLESALTAASRRGILIRRGEEIRKAE